MKKYFFLIVGLFFCTQVWGQSPKSEVVSITLPHGITSLTKDQASKAVHANFKRSVIPLDVPNLDVKNYYQLDGLIISFWDYEVNPKTKRSLQDIQSGILAILKSTGDTVNFSRIITINNILFLEYEIQKDNEIELRFQSEFNKNNKDIGGVVQCKKPDEDKAEKALQDLLQSMHFKE